MIKQHQKTTFLADNLQFLSWTHFNLSEINDDMCFLRSFSDHNRHSTGSESQNLSILSPFDEKEEWHKISEIINSFGTTIGTDVKESTTPNNCKKINFNKFFNPVHSCHAQCYMIFNLRYFNRGNIFGNFNDFLVILSLKNHYFCHILLEK